MFRGKEGKEAEREGLSSVMLRAVFTPCIASFICSSDAKFTVPYRVVKRNMPVSTACSEDTLRVGSPANRRRVELESKSDGNRNKKKKN